MINRAIPTNPTEFEEALSDAAGMAARTQDGTLGEFIRAYAANAMAAKNGDLTKQIQEQVQIGLAEFAKANNTDVNRLDLRNRPAVTDPGAAYNPNAVGAALDKEFTGLTDFLTSVLPADRQRTEDRSRWDRIRNDYSSLDPSKGGYLVPETVRAGLMLAALEQAIIRPGATVIPMDTPRLPIPAVDETTHSGQVYGGVTWTWVAEGQEIPRSDATFRRVVLDVAKLVSSCRAPAELPLDSPAAFGAFINQAMPNALAFGMDSAHLTGDGVGKPLGILNSANTGLVVVAKEGAQAADTILKANIDKMFARMFPTHLMSAVWVATIDTFPQLAALGAGDNSPVWLNNGVKDAPPVTIYGRPVLFTEKTPTLGDQGDISFVARSQYLVGDRGQMRVDSSIHARYENDEIVYRAIDRSDGRPWIVSPVTPANGSANTLSAYVTLADRA